MLNVLKEKILDLMDVLCWKIIRLIAFGSFFIFIPSVFADNTIHVTASHLEVPLELKTWKLYLGDDPKYATPNFNDSLWKAVLVPKDRWKDAGHPQYGWYRIKFRIGKELQEQKLGISLGRIGDADEFFLNGVKVNQTGLIPDGGAVPHFRNVNHKWRVYELPQNSLHYDGINSIAVRVYKEDYHQQGGGIFFGTPKIGSFDKLRLHGLWDYCWTTVKSVLLALIILFIFFDMMIVWWKFPRSKEHLYLALTAFFAALIALCQSRFLYEFDFKILYLDKLNEYALFISCFFQTKFFESLFERKNRVIDYFNTLVCVVMCVLTTASSNSTELMQLCQYWILTLPLFFGYWIFLCCQGFGTNKKEAITILTGLSVMLVFAANDSLAYWDIYVFYDFIPLGFFALFMAMRYAIALRFEKVSKEEEMARSWALLGQSSSELAHDIRSPLNVVKLYTGQIHKRLNDPKFIDEFQRNVDSKVNEMASLVKYLLDSSRNKVKRTDYIELEKIIDESLSKIELGQNIELIKEYGINGTKIFADIHSLPRAFENLIRNAKEAIQGEGTIKIVTSLMGWGKKRIEIKIMDNGCGMTKEVLSKLFIPFYTNKEHGTGYGLSIVHKIIKDHDGSIKVESKPGQGTIFTIYLPVSKEGSVTPGSATQEKRGAA